MAPETDIHKLVISRTSFELFNVNFFSTENITSNDDKVGFPIIYTDTFHHVILFIVISIMLDTTKHWGAIFNDNC